ncbi:hypothetical protein Tco_1310050 [Tanacetum coccineum]
MDDLYNNLKVYEPEVKGMSSSSSSTQNMAFVSSSNNNTNSTNEAVNTTHGVSTASTQVNAANFTNIDNLSDAIICPFFASQPNRSLLLMAMRLLVLINPKWSATTATRGDILLALVSCDGIGGYDWSDQVEEGPNYALMAYSSSSSDSEDDVSQPKIEKKTVMPSIVKKEFVKSKQEKSTRKNVKQARLCVLEALIFFKVDGNYHQKQSYLCNPLLAALGKLFRNNSQRVNHQNVAKKTHPCAKKNLVPREILMKSGLVSINTARQNISKIAVLVNIARQVNIAHSKTTVNATRPMPYLSKTAHSTVKRPIHKNTTFNNSNIDQRVNIVRGKNVNTARPKAVVNVVKHMTGNMSYLTNYEEIDGGYVAFGGNPKGGKIAGKAKKNVRLMTEKLFGMELELILGAHLRESVEKDDRKRARFLDGKISLGRKKSQGSNSDDGGKTRDGGKTVGGAIGARGGRIGDSLLVALYACMTFIYGSSWKGEMASEAKRSLDRSSEGSEEVFPDEAGE